MRFTDAAHARVALRGAVRIGSDARVIGWPSIACAGTLVVGDRVTIVSSPAAVTLVVARGASLEIGDDVVLESGATICARSSIIVGARAHVGVGAVVESACDAPLRIDEDISIEAASEQIIASNRNGLGAPSHDKVATPERVRAVVASIIQEASTIDRDTDLRHVAGWDSLAALRVLVALENDLGVRLPQDLFASPSTLESIAEIARRVA
jgi:acyl carrier protein